MNHLKTMGLFGIVAIAVGMVGFNAVNANPAGVADDVKSNTGEKSTFLGHIIVTVRDPEGHIKAYRQTDNIVTAIGHNCAANLLFGTGFANCTGPATFQYIALTNSSITPGAGDTTLTGEQVNGGMQRQAGTITAAQVATVSPNVAIAQIAKTFTYTGTSSRTVDASGLFDASSTGNMFADHTFSTVTLNTNDQLTVQWQITLS